MCIIYIYYSIYSIGVSVSITQTKVSCYVALSMATSSTLSVSGRAFRVRNMTCHRSRNVIPFWSGDMVQSILGKNTSREKKTMITNQHHKNMITVQVV